MLLAVLFVTSCGTAPTSGDSCYGFQGAALEECLLRNRQPAYPRYEYFDRRR